MERVDRLTEWRTLSDLIVPELQHAGWCSSFGTLTVQTPSVMPSYHHDPSVFFVIKVFRFLGPMFDLVCDRGGHEYFAIYTH